MLQIVHDEVHSTRLGEKISPNYMLSKSNATKKYYQIGECRPDWEKVRNFELLICSLIFQGFKICRVCVCVCRTKY